MGARPLLARPREREPLARARRVHRLERVAHETLRAAERARHVEPAVEAPEILRGLEGLLERGLREAESGGEPFELASVDIGHGLMMRQRKGAPFGAPLLLLEVVLELAASRRMPQLA